LVTPSTPPRRPFRFAAGATTMSSPKQITVGSFVHLLVERFVDGLLQGDFSGHVGLLASVVGSIQ